MPNNFAAQFQIIDDFVQKTSKEFLSAMDQITFKMLINYLKSEDPIVVSDSIDQLIKENRSIAIPPLYFVSRLHFNENLRKKALNAVHTLDKEKKVEELTKDKAIDEAVRTLINHYGNFRAS